MENRNWKVDRIYFNINERNTSKVWFLLGLMLLQHPLKSIKERKIFTTYILVYFFDLVFYLNLPQFRLITL
jgi:hypothetical protein